MMLTMLALVFGGCGNDEGAAERAQVSTVVAQYFSAFARADGTELCSLLTQRAQETMVDVAQSEERERRRAVRVRSCAEVVRSFGRVPSFNRGQVLSVSITGAHATARVRVGNFPVASVTLSKTAQGWLINKVPGQI